MDNISIKPAMLYYIEFEKSRRIKFMLKLLAKIAERYAKSTNTACIIWGMFHQPKMPASLIKKD